MENERFHELMLDRLGRVVQKLEQHDKRFDAQLVKVEGRLGNVEDLLKKHRKYMKKTSRQIELLITKQENLFNYFQRRREMNKHQETTTTTCYKVVVVVISTIFLHNIYLSLLSHSKGGELCV